MDKFKKLFYLIFILTAILIMEGCQSTKDKEDHSEPKNEPIETKETIDPVDETENKKTETEITFETQPLPQTLQEVVEYPVGEYASEAGDVADGDMDTIINQIPDLPEDATEEELVKLLETLYSLFKMEYEDPMTLLSSNGITSGPDGEGDTQPEKASYNVIIALDASGSMANKIGSKTRMDLAKEAIEGFVSKLPKEANVGLRVYGHKGTGTSADKALSCAANELVYPIQPYSETELKNALNDFNPAGWTPLAGAIEAAQKDLQPYQGENNQNVIYVVSDGVETCGGDPVKAAALLKDENISPVVHIIGFDVASKEQQQLKDVAEAAGGTYTNAKDHKQLQSEFDKALQNSKEWFNWWTAERGKLVSDKFEERDRVVQHNQSWKAMNRSESYKIQDVLFELSYREKISSGQRTTLMNMRNKYYWDMADKADNMYKILMSESYSDYDEMKKEINRIYDESVSN
ncbi:vWA domain-containing protein [Sporosarcina sp. FSL K6-3457]|uniref:vWA domain-containing protein n=1 Tax=Sporosarcina sp. FSL K6-3457 TaxID=2978204 RepID=UPI0030F87705